MGAKTFVTGGTGLIGSNLIKKLILSGEEVTLFSHGNSKHPFLEDLKLDIKSGDIRDYDSVLKAVEGHDKVYHLAAMLAPNVTKKNDMFDTNVKGTDNMMRAAFNSNVKKIVHVSSTSVFGYTSQESTSINENSSYCDEQDPNSYGCSKKLAEYKVLEYANKGLNATIVIPCSVIGPGEETALFYTLVKNINRGRIKFAFPGGTSVVSVEDLADALVLAMAKGEKGERYIIASEYLRLIDQFNIIADTLKKPRIKFQLPKISFYPAYIAAGIFEKFSSKPLITRESIKHAYGYRKFDSRKAREHLGWRPKIPFEKSVNQAIEYYKNHKSF
jgi:dihydroflavonol-4-reductase